jgi:hypothetical protein
VKEKGISLNMLLTNHSRNIKLIKAFGLFLLHRNSLVAVRCVPYIHSYLIGAGWLSHVAGVFVISLKMCVFILIRWETDQAPLQRGCWWQRRSPVISIRGPADSEVDLESCAMTPEERAEGDTGSLSVSEQPAGTGSGGSEPEIDNTALCAHGHRDLCQMGQGWIC